MKMYERVGPGYIDSEDKTKLDKKYAKRIATAILPAASLAVAMSVVDCRTLNPIYTQERPDFNGEARKIYKIRTIAPLAESDVSYGAQDPRATCLGNMLRKSGVDESPQLLEVFRGNMSVVGIRQMLDRDYHAMEAADPILFNDVLDARKEAGAKPALTGLSTLYRRYIRPSMNDVTWVESMKLDMTYLENASERMDREIISTTPGHLVRAAISPITVDPALTNAL